MRLVLLIAGKLSTLYIKYPTQLFGTTKNTSTSHTIRPSVLRRSSRFDTKALYSTPAEKSNSINMWYIIAVFAGSNSVSLLFSHPTTHLSSRSKPEHMHQSHVSFWKHQLLYVTNGWSVCHLIASEHAPLVADFSMPAKSITHLSYESQLHVKSSNTACTYLVCSIGVNADSSQLNIAYL